MSTFSLSLYLWVCVYVRDSYSPSKMGRAYTSQQLRSAFLGQEQELPVKATTVRGEAGHNDAAMFATLGHLKEVEE